MPETTNDHDPRDNLLSILHDSRICMLTTMQSDGKHVSRPMALQEAEFDGDLWFFTYLDSDKVRDITVNPAVNVSFSNQKSNAWVSLAGQAEVLNDMQKAAQLWAAPLNAWFPEGLQTPGMALIKVHADSAEYWDTPNSKAVQAFGMVKAAVTGKPPKPGDNQTVEL